MPSPTEITVAQLSRLIGTPDAPVLIDICIDEDFAADPRLVPGAFRHPFGALPNLVPELQGRRVVVICQKGKKLSQGAAAVLRDHAVAAENLEGGNFAWRDAGKEWEAYGDRQIPTSWGDMIRLGQLQATREELARLERELDEEKAPGIRERLRQERIDKLSPEEQALVEMSLEEMDGKTYDQARFVQEKIAVSPYDVAKQVSGDDRVKARQLARRIDRTREVVGRMENYRQQVKEVLNILNADESLRETVDVSLNG